MGVSYPAEAKKLVLEIQDALVDPDKVSKEKVVALLIALMELYMRDAPRNWWR